jgi:hypothetical protein
MLLQPASRYMDQPQQFRVKVLPVQLFVQVCVPGVLAHAG